VSRSSQGERQSPNDLLRRRIDYVLVSLAFNAEKFAIDVKG
jgi:endonuclease/exonuclease/phosphatase family metal-dependent hydrolase